MSCGNYHLTMATTPEAPTEDDVTHRPAKPEKWPTESYHRAFYTSHKMEHCVFSPPYGPVLYQILQRG